MNKIHHQSDQPYQSLACIYEYIMHHVDYENWSEYVEALGKYFGHTFENVLDMACGVGLFSSYFGENGYNILGVDKSEMMIEQARKSNTLSNVRYEIGDMRTYQSEKKFDTILCLYDSINYLTTIDDLEKAFANMSTLLEKNGLLIFDFTTAKNSLQYFDGTEEFEETLDFCYWRKSTYSPRKNMQFTKLVIFIKEGDLYRQYHEKHEQKIFPFKFIQSALKKAGLEVVGTFHEFTFNEPSLESLRIHIVAQKQH